MEIKFKNYILKPGLYAKDRWDVIKLVPLYMRENPMMRKKHPKARVGDYLGETRDEIAYDLLLENALQKLISYLLAEKEETTDLMGYLSEYKKLLAELKQLVSLT